MTNADIVVDPDGFVPPQGSTTVPYVLTEADRRIDVIVLSPLAPAIQVKLEAPDGSTFDGAHGAVLVSTPTYQTLRLSLPPTLAAGTWRAHLSLDSLQFQRYLASLKQKKATDELARAQRHGVAFTLSVQSRSSVHLGVAVSQPSRRPGSIATVRATLTQAGIPLDYSASLRAYVTAPTGVLSQVPLPLVESGLYSGDVATPVSGVYRVLVRATGSTLGSHQFTREQLRTLAVWPRGDDTNYPRSPDAGRQHPDWCALLACILKDGGLQKAARSRGIDLGQLLTCLDDACR